MTSYIDVVYPKFLNEIEDVGLFQMSEEVRNEMCFEFMENALADIEGEGIYPLFNTLEIDKETGCFSKDLKSYEIRGIVYYMVSCWYEQKENSLEHTILWQSTKDEKAGNQKQHWEETSNKRWAFHNRGKKLFLQNGFSQNEYLKGN